MADITGPVGGNFANGAKPSLTEYKGAIRGARKNLSLSNTARNNAIAPFNPGPVSTVPGHAGATTAAQLSDKLVPKQATLDGNKTFGAGPKTRPGVSQAGKQNQLNKLLTKGGASANAPGYGQNPLNPTTFVK